MRFGTEFTAAISFFSFISFATAQTAPTAVDFLDVESSENSTALAKRNPDCDFAAWQWADVDCNYKWIDNILDYYVMITPTGQETPEAWTKGILDNVKGDCGVPEDRLTPVEVKGWERRKLHHPKTHEVREMDGLFLHFTYRWPWTPGDDSRGCIESAIRKGSCYGGISFKNNGCYKV